MPTADPAQDLRGRGRDFAATSAIVLTTIGAVLVSRWGMPPAHREQQCAQLLDRFVALRTLAANPSASLSAIELRQVEVRERVGNGGALAKCTARLTEESARCADEANSADELERCFF